MGLDRIKTFHSAKHALQRMKRESTKWEKHLTIIYRTKDQHPERMRERSKLNSKRMNNPSKKQVTDLDTWPKRTQHGKDTQGDAQHHRLRVGQGSAGSGRPERPLQARENGRAFKMTVPSLGKDGSKGRAGQGLRLRPRGHGGRESRPNTHLPHSPAAPSQGIYSGKTEAGVYTDTSVHMFVAALFVIPPHWKAPKRSLQGQAALRPQRDTLRQGREGSPGSHDPPA